MSTWIPAAHSEPFVGGIVHPTLYLWDAWSYLDGDKIHLYCLAVSRTDSEGRRLDPAKRNERPFHVRHFVSSDDAKTWTDAGCFQEPTTGSSSFDSRTLWSGSIAPLADGNKLVAYTGVRENGPDLTFQQSIGLAISRDGSRIDHRYKEPISCCYRDWQTITDLGYYLGDKSGLGHQSGEAGGPILAWRDPFVFVEDDLIHLFWGAKVGSHQSALAHALINKADSGFEMSRLCEPVTVPDGHEFTQLELPKILYDGERGRYYLLISTCNRLFEGQTDAEVDKRVRLYSSSSLNGPWLPDGKDGSTILRDDRHMFGLTVLDADFERGELRCIAPYTDAADERLRLTLSEPFAVKLRSAA